MISFLIPIYGGQLIVCTTHDEYKEACKGIEVEADDDELNESRGLSSRHSNKANEAVYLVGVFDKDEGTLVHELVHTVFDLLSFCGIPINKRNDEVFAYLMDALYKESIAAMRPDANPSAV